jgi:hypothetical protein
VFGVSRCVKENLLIGVSEQQGGTEALVLTRTLPGWLKVITCLVFLSISFLLWLSIKPPPGRTLYYILFLIPNYICGEYLGSKIFSEKSGLSISQSGFSILRILFGVLFVFGFFGVVYGMALLIRWLL